MKDKGSVIALKHVFVQVLDRPDQIDIDDVRQLKRHPSQQMVDGMSTQLRDVVPRAILVYKGFQHNMLQHLCIRSHLSIEDLLSNEISIEACAIQHPFYHSFMGVQIIQPS